MKRRIAIAVPACNEAGFIGACLAGLAQAAASDKGPPPDLVVLANNCTDETAEIARRHASDGQCRLHIQSVALPPDRSHAGWARRLALDLAASLLTEPDDIILSTDADTVVAENWISRTLNYIEDGYDAVAGLARLNPSELRRLAPPHRRRLAQIRRYGHAIDYLKAQHDLSEPWPRHFYEGGASMALTLGMYRAIGGAPTPTVGEDKALFDAVRRSGGKVRHASDVRVRTSARLHGRAVGGASDTLALWGRQSQDEPAAGLHNIATCLGQTSANEGGLTFKDLPRETQRARFLVEQARRPLAFA